MTKKEEFALGFAKFILLRNLYIARTPDNITKMEMSNETKMRLGELIKNGPTLLQEYYNKDLKNIK